MSGKQTAQQHRASGRAQRTRRIVLTLLCSFAGTAVTPAPHDVGMRTSESDDLLRLRLFEPVMASNEVQS